MKFNFYKTTLCVDFTGVAFHTAITFTSLDFDRVSLPWVNCGLASLLFYERKHKKKDKYDFNCLSFECIQLIVKVFSHCFISSYKVISDFVILKMRNSVVVILSFRLQANGF